MVSDRDRGAARRRVLGPRLRGIVELRDHRGYVAAKVLVGQRPRKDATAARITRKPEPARATVDSVAPAGPVVKHAAANVSHARPQGPRLPWRWSSATLVGAAPRAPSARAGFSICRTAPRKPRSMPSPPASDEGAGPAGAGARPGTQASPGPGRQHARPGSPTGLIPPEAIRRVSV